MTEDQNKLLNLLVAKGIKDKRVIEAIKQIPREIFLTGKLASHAYEDRALPIDCGQTISQPYTVAYMTELLGVKKNDKVLEIGTGSGYQAIVLYMMGAKVFTIERQDKLHRKAVKLFKKYDISINTRFGDGSLGWKDYAPFDKIILTAASPKIPELLKKQLAIGGRIVVPVGDKNSQVMYMIEKVSDTVYRTYKKGDFRFVPLIGKEGFSDEQ